jgi:hypothetical protein
MLWEVNIAVLQLSASRLVRTPGGKIAEIVLFPILRWWLIIIREVWEGTFYGGQRRDGSHRSGIVDGEYWL